MGKRELLLIVAFLIVGAVVYQATAPPAGPNERHLSFSGIFEKVRREIRGNRASAQETRATTHELDGGVTEVRVTGGYAELSITGQDRRNIEVQFRVTSTGYDDEEARRLVGQTLLKADRAGSALRLTSQYPNPGSQRAYLTLLVPAGLNVRVDQGAPRTAVANVASVEMSGVRGEHTLKKIAGRASIAHRSGRLVVDEVATLKVSGRSSDVTASNVRGDASFSLQSGELDATSIGGPIDVDSQGADVTLKNLGPVKGSLRVNATGGSVTLEGLQGDARIDGRGAEIEIEMTKAATVAVYNEGDESIQIVPPPGGFVLDALATNGRLTVPDDVKSELTISAAGEDQEQRATGPVRGGGPTITLRANNGDIRILSRESTKPER